MFWTDSSGSRSLFAILKGLKIERANGGTEDFSEVYVDLEANRDEQIVDTDLTGKEPTSCIKLVDLLYEGLTKLAAYPKEYHANLERYKKRVESYDFSIIKVRDVPIDVATEIFTRINVGGVPLSLFEIMAAKTYDENLKFDLCEKYDAVIELLESVNYETISDVSVLQLIALILRGDCKKQTILKLTKSEFIETWPNAIDGIERAVEYLICTYRIPSRNFSRTTPCLYPLDIILSTPGQARCRSKITFGRFFRRRSLAGRSLFLRSRVNWVRT